MILWGGADKQTVVEFGRYVREQLQCAKHGGFVMRNLLGAQGGEVLGIFSAVRCKSGQQRDHQPPTPPTPPSQVSPSKTIPRWLGLTTFLTPVSLFHATYRCRRRRVWAR